MDFYIGSYLYSYRSFRQHLKWILIFQAILCVWTPTSTQNVTHAISIFDVRTPNGNINRDAINSVLDQVGNRLVKVISINGPSRSGKSFLLGYFIRYFESKSGNVKGPLSGFDWRGGQEGVTVGINLWSKPYFVKTEDGDEIAVLLLDTQGLFDKKTTYRQNAIIFTISALLSSVFMYNQKHLVLENTLQHISCFSNLAGNIAKNVNEGSSLGALELPSNLMFVLRDLDMAEYKHGLHTSDLSPKGSPNNYVRDLFISKSSDAAHSAASENANPEENLRIRMKLKKFYSDISAFVMPHPGSRFLMNTASNVPCDEFQEQAQSLVTSIVSLKTTSVSRKEFNKILDSIEHVSSNSARYFLNARSIEDMQCINENMSALNKARALYERRLDSFLDQHPDGASDASLMKVSTEALPLVLKEFQDVEECSSEFNDQFSRERKVMLDQVLSSARDANNKNTAAKLKLERAVLKAERRAERRVRRSNYNSGNNAFQKIGDVLAAGGFGAAALGGTVVPVLGSAPGIIAAGVGVGMRIIGGWFN